MLTTFFVNSLDDGNPIQDNKLTLREALQAAASDTAVGDAPAGSGTDIIRFEPELFASVQLGAPAKIDVLGQMDIEGNTLIIGPGAEKLSLDAGGNLYRVFAIDANSTALISGIEVTGGGNGGIVSRGELTLVDSIVRDNTAIINAGGGITNFGVKLVVENTVIRENKASGDGGGLASFGGEVQVSNTTIFGNSSGGNGGGVFLNSSPSNGKPNAQFVNVTISTNVAERNGGGIAKLDGELNIFHATITGNSSDFNGNGIGAGGGIHNPGSRLFMTSTIVAGNFRGNLDTEVPNDLDGLLDPDASHASIIGDPNSASLLYDRNDPEFGFRTGNIIGDGNGGVLPIDDILDPTIQSTFGIPVHTLGIDSVAIDQGLPTYEPLIAVDGAKFHYRFNERGEGIVVDRDIDDFRIADSTPIGGATDAFLEGKPNLEIAGPTPALGSAIEFDGADDRILTNPIGLDDFTISMWVKPSSLGAFSEDWFDGDSLIDNFGTDGFGLSILGANFAFGVGSKSDPTQNTTIKSDTLAIDGKWHHLVATRDGTTGRMIMYIDGLIHRFADGPIGPRTTRTLTLGNRISSSDYYRGSMDEVAIFDKVLTASQVRQQFVSASLPVNDQRGFPFRRSVFEETPFDLRFGAPDIGAFERQPVSPVSSNVLEVSTLVDESDGNFTPGDLSLREAIELANRSPDRNIIRFSPDLAANLSSDGSAGVAESIDIVQGEMPIEFDVSIEGFGPESLTINQAGIGPIFFISEVAMVEMRGLRITGTDGDSAILNDGHLNIHDTLFDNNINASDGGAILNFGQLSIANSEFRKNQAIFGGAILNEGTLDILPGVRFIDNQAEVSGGAIFNAGMLTIDRALIEGNSAFEGGGINNSDFLSTVVIRQSQLIRNRATNGGGLYSEGDVTIFGSSIMLNSASVGGGLYLSNFDGGLVDSNEISANKATSDVRGGGGIYTNNSGVRVSNNTIWDNDAIGSNARGGGIFVDSSSFPTRLSHNTIAKNQILTIIPRGGDAAAVPNRGAGLFINGTVTLQSNILDRNFQNVQEEGDDLLSFFGQRDNDMLVGAGTIAIAVNNLISIESGVPTSDSRFVTCSPTGPNSAQSCKGIDPMLESNAEQNGGPTRTFKLKVGSPALDRSSLDRLVDQRGFPTIDQENLGNSGMTSDIGSYESEPILIELFDSSTASVENGVLTKSPVSQFVERTSVVQYGLGFDDGKPGSTIPKEPGFLGFQFDPDPYTFGGIGEGAFGDRYGAEVTLDFGGRAGIEYGYFLDAGSVAINYDSMFRILSDETSAGTFEIQTASFIEDGNLFTVSPRVGAYADLVFELDASISGTGCLIACTDPFNLPISLSKTVPLFSINRQQTIEVNGQDVPAFASGDTLVADSNGGNNPPAFDGQIMFGAGSLGDILADEAGGAAESFLDELSSIREERTMAMMMKAQAEQDLRRNPNDNAAKQRADEAQKMITKADADEKKKSKKKNSGGGDLCIGTFVTACIGPATDGLLGVEATLGVGAAIGPVSVSKPIGSIQVTIPDVQLSDTELNDEAGTLSATTDDFAPGSIQDNNRQIAKLSVDVAGVLGPLIGIPAGRYEAELGDVLSVSLQTISYDVQPRLAATQDVRATPFFHTNQQLQSLPEADRRGTKFTFNTPVNVSIVGTSIARNGVMEFWFQPGSTLSVTSVSGTPVEVTPDVRLGYQFSNDIGLDIDVKGILEALAINVEVFGKTIVDIGPLIRYEHEIGNFDLGSVFTTDTPLNLSTSVERLATFTLGTQPGVVVDGKTPGGALAIPVGLNEFASAVRSSAQLQPTFYSFPTTMVEDNGTMAPAVSSIEGLRFDVVSVNSNDPLIDVVVAQSGITLVDGVGPTAERIVLKPNLPQTLNSSASWSLEGFDASFGDGRSFLGILSRNGDIDFRVQGILSENKFTAGDLIDSERIDAVNNSNLPGDQVLNPFFSDGVRQGTFAPLDIDEDGEVSIQSDLVFIQQFASGVAPLASLVGANALRTTSEQLTSKLEGLRTAGTLNANQDNLLFDATDAALISMFFFGQDNNLMDPQDISVVDRLVVGLRGSTISSGISNQQERAARLAAEQGLQMTRTAGDDFLGIRTTNEVVGRVSAFEISENAVLGSSPWMPYELVPAGDFPAAELANFGASIQIEDIIVAADPNMPDNGAGMPGAAVVASSAAGTPPRLMAMAEMLSDLAQTRDRDMISQVPIPGMDTRETSRMTRSAFLGQDSSAPIFFRLPDAGGWDISIPDGVLITDIVFDTNVGGNMYLNHDPRLDGSNVDFDIVFPETGQRVEFSMDRGGDGYARLSDVGFGSVSRFILYPRSLPLATLQRIDNLERPEIDLIVGLVIDDSQAVAPGEPPILIAEQLYAREEIFTPNAVVAAPDTATDFAIERNDLAIDVDGTFTSRVELTVNGQGQEFTIGDDNQLISSMLPGVFPTSAFAKIEFLGSSEADTLTIGNGDLPFFVPIEFDGGGDDFDVLVAGSGNVTLDLTTQITIRNVELIRLNSSGDDTLVIDAQAVYDNDPGKRSLIILGGPSDQIHVLGDGWRRREDREDIGLGSPFDVWEFNDGLNPHLAGVLLFVSAGATS